MQLNYQDMHIFIRTCVFIQSSLFRYKAQRSPLTQCGLEIKSMVTATWTDQLFLERLREFIQQNYYSMKDNERDDFLSILGSLNLTEVTDSSDDKDIVEIGS